MILASRIAREWTGGDGFVVTNNAYHGTTTATAALSPSLRRSTLCQVLRIGALYGSGWVRYLPLCGADEEHLSGGANHVGGDRVEVI